MPRFQHALYMMTKNHDIGPTFAGNMRGGKCPSSEAQLVLATAECPEGVA
jgi:hypothetical protein